MLDQVLSSWERWCRSAAGARALRRWRLRSPDLATWGLDELRRPVGGERTDRMQATLVRWAAGGDDAAALTLMVQFRPALHRLARGRARAASMPFDDAAGDVMAVFTEVLLTHDLDRRPSRIAANLMWDTRQRLARADRRSASELPVPMSSEEDDRRPARNTTGATGTTTGSDTVDLVASVAEALDTLSGNDASRRLTRELAFRAWFLGETNAELARELGVEASAVRARLCRLRSAVRDRYRPESRAAA